MATLSEIRAQYPQYNDMPDEQLADSLYQKFYSDMPRDQFNEKLGLSAPQQLEAPAGPVASDAQRLASMPASGFVRSVTDTLGALPDLAASGMRKVGLPAPEQGYYGNALRDALTSAGKPIVEAQRPKSLSAFGQQYLGDTAQPQKMVPQPVPQTTMEKALYGAGQGVGDALSFAAPAAVVANTAKAGGLVSNVAKTMASQPVTQLASGATGGAVGEATDNPLLGVAASLATPAVMATGSRAITPVRSGLGAEGDRLAAVAEREGLKLTPGQKTGSKRLQTFESVLEELPFSGPRQQAINEGNREAFNASALRRAGVDAKKASPEVIDQAFKELGNKFTSLASKTTVNLDDTFLTKLQDVSMKYGNKLESQKKPIIESYISDILDLGNQVPGAKYQNIRSDISRQASGTSDPQFKSALNGIRDALDNAAERSMPIELKGEWSDVRKKYSALKSVSKAMASAGNGASEGNIPPAQFASAVRQASGADQYSRGAGDLNDIARIGKQFVQPKTPNSGTAQRTAFTNMLSGGFATGGGIGTYMMTHDPLLALGGAAASMATPSLASRVYNSRPMNAYLTNRAVQGPKVSRELLGLLAAEREKQQALGLLD